METLFILLIVLAPVVLAGVSLRWGFDSTDSIDSPEWERRRTWRGFH